MIKIHPKKLKGNWTEGYALDQHVITSIPIGENEYGHMQFDNERSEIGEIIYKLKYKSNISNLEILLETVSNFLEQDWRILSDIDSIIPIPPSNIHRSIQPVILIAEELSKHLELPYYEDVLIKNKSTDQVKNINKKSKRKDMLQDLFEINAKEIAKKNILVIDDVYQSGSTLASAVNSLQNDGNVSNVYVLTMTYTKNAP
jgi:competence protein ComFC